MRRSRKALQATAVALMVSILTANVTALAGTWQRDSKGWKYMVDGVETSSNWFQDTDGNWYHIGPDGYMQKGWFQDIDTNWYYLADTGAMMKNSWLQGAMGKWYYLSGSGSMLKNQWYQNVDGKWYYFGGDGAMYSNTTTPDGYTVNADGSWNVDIPKKTVTAVRKSSGGGGSGGSSSSSGSHGNSSQDKDDAQPPEGSQEDDKNNPSDGNQGDNGGGKDEIVATPSEAVEYYNYQISYKDIESSNILYEVIGEAEKGSAVNIEHRTIDGYQICANQPSMFHLNQKDKVVIVYYEKLQIASPSEALQIDWEVHFVDAETHGTTLAASRAGTIEEGGSLYINYMSRIVKDIEVWEAVEPPPVEVEVWGPGLQIFYIEYENAGYLEDEDDPYEEEKKQLSEWLETAKEYESAITGEDSNQIPAARFYVTDQSSNNVRVRSIATQIEDTDEYVFYIVGKNWEPNGLAVPNYFGDEAVYSNLLEDVIVISDDTYYIARMTIERNYDPDTCDHEWELTRDTSATCLSKGTKEYECMKCGETVETVTAALGHVDWNNDSVCDQCNLRTFPQEIGSEIATTLSIEGNTQRNLTFVCIDEDYQGGMLYISKEAIPLNDFGGYGDLDYAESNPGIYFHGGFQNGFSINGSPLLPITWNEGVNKDYAMLLSQEEVLQYQDVIPGDVPFYTRTADGNQLIAVNSDGSFQPVTPASGNGYGIRPVILLQMPDEGTPDPVHWSVGDMQAREIDGNTYIFECIDQNYSDRTENHRQAALFLCSTVIPADTGSEWVYEEQIDGNYDYTYSAGPIVNFGNANDYKYSKIRKWLDKSESNFFGAEDVNIGVDYAYIGNTEAGRYGKLDDDGLNAYYIGNQKLTAKVFILSVDEALKYREYLWSFNGAGHENPETQYGPYCKAYWLRNPMGTSSEYDETQQIYVVDLANGNIHPNAIKPEGGTGDDELDVTGTVGVRPAFALPQN